MRETMNPYYQLSEEEETCDMILKEFGLPTKGSHIINGHMPVKIKSGETPIRAGGKLFIIDGGLSKAYQERTGIAGYTLIFNSHHLALAEHKPFDPERERTPKVYIVEKMQKRITVADTDEGKGAGGPHRGSERALESVPERTFERARALRQLKGTGTGSLFLSAR